MKRAILALIVLTATLLAQALAGGRSDSVVKVKARLEKGAAGQEVVVVNLDIQKGWHLYANPVENDNYKSGQLTVKVLGAKPETKAGKVDYPAGHPYKDQSGDKLKIYEDKIEVRAAVDRAAGDAGPIEVSVKLSACNDNSCLLPAVVRVKVP
jgi:hypothetical protein